MKKEDRERKIKAPKYDPKVKEIMGLIQKLGEASGKLTDAKIADLQGALERANASTIEGTYESPDGKFWGMDALEISHALVKDVHGVKIQDWPDPERKTNK